MSRIINRLVEASGGWEVFLYKTLKDVCNEMDTMLMLQPEVGLLEEAREILEAYEELAGGHPDQARKRPAVINDQSVDESAKPAQPNKFESHKTEVKLPKPVPRKLHAKVPVDKEVGGSHGELPMPAGFNLVNRDTLTVTTQNGLELGKGSADGQVRGQGVSGQVTSSGAYRLVFTDVDLGAGVIHFEAALVPKPAPAPVLAPKPESEPVQHPAMAKLAPGEGI